MRNAMDAITLRDLEYLESLQGKLTRVFARMDEEGGREGIPIVGTSVGRALHVLVRATGARTVVEVGTAIGYSALWMATALPADGRLDTIDPDRSRTDRARRFWDEAGVGAKIVVHSGKGLVVLPALAGPYDFAFIDALKTEYEDYLAAVLRLLRPGGTVAVDNLLWGGRASGAREDDRTAETSAVRAFNAKFVTHPQLDATILPVGDGLGIGVKKAQAAHLGRKAHQSADALDESVFGERLDEPRHATIAELAL